MVSFQELKEKYPIQNIAPYGACIIVPGAEFNPDWEAELEEQGVKCFFTDLDKRPVTLVQLKGAPPETEEKLVYAPSLEASPGKAKLITSRDVQQRAKDARHRKYGDDWRPEEELFLIELHKKHLPYWKIAKEMQEKFPNRTDHAIFYRISALLKQGKIKPRFERRKQRPKKNMKAAEDLAAKEPIPSKPIDIPMHAPTSGPVQQSGLEKVIEALDGLVEAVDKLGCQVIMHALEIKELKGSDGFKIPLRLWASYADAVLESDKKHRDIFREKVHKLLEAAS